jgi:hypothetical protein
MQVWSLITSMFWVAALGIGLYVLLTSVLPRVYSHGSDFRSVVHELNKAKAYAADSTRALRACDDELQSARGRVAKLSAEVAEKSSALSAAKLELDETRVDVDTLRLRLAASEARQQELQEVAEKASVVRWELASRFGNNEEARTAALNDLRRPPQSFPVLTPRPVEKTASDSILQLQRPDLSISDSEGSSSASDEFSGSGLGSRSSTPREGEWLHVSAPLGQASEENDQPEASPKNARQQLAPRLYGQSSYPPATSEAKMRRGVRRRRPVGHRPRTDGPALNASLPPRPWNGALQSPSSLAGSSAQTALTTRTGALTGKTPELVELQRAPWTASPEASEARRGLAMEALLQPSDSREAAE